MSSPSTAVLSTPSVEVTAEFTPLLDPFRDPAVQYSVSHPANGAVQAPVSTTHDIEANDAAARTVASKPGDQRMYSDAFVARTVAALLVAVFMGNADASLVMATHTTIASSFGDLQNSSWLFIGFNLAGAATQSLFGKLSDIYGRRPMLLISYGLFAIGWRVTPQVLPSDLAPLRQVATWQSYMNVGATIGRSLGGPIGGLMADTIVPDLPATAREDSTRSHLKSPARIDFLGALLLGASLLSLLLPLELGGQKLSWTDPLIFMMFGVGSVLVVLFASTEARFAKEPIVPLRLFKNSDVVMTCVIYCAQCAAQVGMMFSVPLYFQITQNVSGTEAGAHLFPAVIGNTLGGILAGVWIKRTGRYKALLLVGATSSFASYVLLLLRWHGDTDWWESLYIIPGGFGTGVSLSAAFIALQAVIEPEDKAVASSVLFLALPVGSVLGIALSSAATVSGMRSALLHRLIQLGLKRTNAAEIVEKAASNLSFADAAPPAIAAAIRASYVDGLAYGHVVSLVAVVLAFIAGLCIHERIL
ncbi:major facilitator superfamily domain-containing protein [Microdochium bolleyi]|uniref:Major facilitator superfamily domain-containing protein n=1 Tax=Microdochium bolleyi TaxID=196109 RepID=A0A136J8Y1_9PEZI|nr:major facilitator superfamily domain-containing protein [Microdochium bolleyi]